MKHEAPHEALVVTDPYLHPEAFQDDLGPSPCTPPSPCKRVKQQSHTVVKEEDAVLNAEIPLAKAVVDQTMQPPEVPPLEAEDMVVVWTADGQLVVDAVLQNLLARFHEHATLVSYNLFSGWFSASATVQLLHEGSSSISTVLWRCMGWPLTGPLNLIQNIQP